MGVEGSRPQARDKVLQPVATPYGVPLLSMGQLVDADKAIAWRGPMVSGALAQLVDANWGDSAILVLDLPPGTGDVQLSMVQKHKRSEEHTSELQSLMRISYAVFCLKKKKKPQIN